MVQAVVRDQSGEDVVISTYTFSGKPVLQDAFDFRLPVVINSEVDSGLHDLMIYARDSSGQATTSGPFDLEILPTALPPKITLAVCTSIINTSRAGILD